MAAEFCFLHFGPSQVPPDLLTKGRIFKTCLRNLVFVEEPAAKLEEGEYFQGSEAYQFLLEVVCGLHSPIVGETEVFGQFKNFVKEILASTAPEDQALKKVFTQINAQAKEVRQRFLKSLGSQTYGSLVRRRIKGCDLVEVIGSGQLAQKILPWVNEDNTQLLRLWCRDPAKVQNFKLPERVQIDHFAEFSGRACHSKQAALVIAAPLSDGELGQALKGLKWKILIDLRGEGDLKKIFGDNIVSLSDLFAELQVERKKLMPTIHQAEQYIRGLTESYYNRAEIRPFGWDDLCV